MPLFYFVACWYGILNLIGFFIFGKDKRSARLNRQRTPEKRLFLVAFLGGALGCLIGMYAFHHKTKHQKFVIGIPLLLGLHGSVWIMLFFFQILPWRI